MGSKAEKRYKDSPTIEKDEEGRPKVKKKMDRKSDETAKGEPVSEGMSSPVRHAMERREMFGRHETEHSMADHKKMDKKEIHGRHLKEMADMNKRHVKEGKGEA